jgi:hypothetical protein
MKRVLILMNWTIELHGGGTTHEHTKGSGVTRMRGPDMRKIQANQRGGNRGVADLSQPRWYLTSQYNILMFEFATIYSVG